MCVSVVTDYHASSVFPLLARSLQKDRLQTKTTGRAVGRSPLCSRTNNAEIKSTETDRHTELKISQECACWKISRDFGFRRATRNVCALNGRERGCDSTPEPHYPDAHSPECMQSGCGAPHSSHATRSIVRLAAFRWPPRSPHHTEIGTVD